MALRQAMAASQPATPNKNPGFKPATGFCPSLDKVHFYSEINNMRFFVYQILRICPKAIPARNLALWGRKPAKGLQGGAALVNAAE
jgi:hypothetical protein